MKNIKIINHIIDKNKNQNIKKKNFKI